MSQPMVTLKPLAMIRPSVECIYAPSRLGQSRQISYQEFLSKFADNARSIPVSFEADGVSNPQRLTAYGYLMDCWYLVEVVQ